MSNKPGDPGLHPEDLNKDGVVNILDAQLKATNAAKNPQQAAINKFVPAAASAGLDSVSKEAFKQDHLNHAKTGPKVAASDRSLVGKPSAKALEFVEGLASALSADSKAPDLTPLHLCFIRDNLSAFTRASVSQINSFGWPNFSCLLDNDVASFVSKVNGYYPRRDSMRSFVNMDNTEKAKLYPKIKLWKVSGPRKTQIVLPPSYGQGNPQSLENILGSSGAGLDFGLKSLDFDFKNQNAFGAGRIVDVRISFFLSSGEALMADRGGYSLADLVLRRGQRDPKMYDPKSYELQLEVGYMKNGGRLDTALEDSTLSMILNLVEYDLDILENGVINLTVNYKARLEQDLEDKFDYDIFGEGTQSAAAAVKEVEGLLSKQRANTRKAKEKLKKVRDEKEALPPVNGWLSHPSYLATKSASQRASTGGGSTGFSTLDEIAEADKVIRDAEKDVKSAEEATRAVTNRLSRLKQRNKISKYGRVLQTIVAHDKLRSMVVAKTALILYGEEFEKILQAKIDQVVKSQGITSAQDYARAANRLRSNLRSVVSRKGVDSSGAESMDFDAMVNKKVKDSGGKLSHKEALLSLGFNDMVGKKGRSTVAGRPTGFFSKIGNDFNSAFNVSLFNTEADSKDEFSDIQKIHWFYFGDLVNATIEQNRISGKLKSDHLGFVMGPINIDVGQGQVVELANIADIPITLDMYQQFFFKNVVEKDLDEYYLHDFLRQAIHQLLAPSLNQKCFGTSIENPITVDTVTIELNQPLESAYAAGSSKQVGSVATPYLGSGAGSKRFYLNGALKSKIAHSRMGVKSVSPNKRWSYVVYYSNDSRIGATWRGNEQSDLNKGIFHFKPGISSGLVKQFKFRKNKKPGFTTMMVERAFLENKESIQLWAIFDIDLTLIGNTLLKPGMHIYVDPSTVGMGSPQSLNSFSRTIGIGGYYLVTSVSNTISDGEWETQVVGKWVSSGAATGAVSIAPRKANAQQTKKAVGKKKKASNKKKKTSNKKKKGAGGPSPKGGPIGGLVTYGQSGAGVPVYVNADGEYVYGVDQETAATADIE